MNQHYPKYKMVEIGQNTEMSPGELRRLAVTQTDQQLMLVRKTHKRAIVIV